MLILPRQYAESRPDSPGGSGGTAGTLAGPGGESDETVRSATLSARARQLTPQAVEREAAWFRARREPGLDWRELSFTVALAALLAILPGSAAAAIATGGAPTAAGGPPAPPSATGHARHRRPQRRHPDPGLGEGHPAGLLLLRRPQPEPALRNRKHASPRTTSASTSSTRPATVVRSFYRNDVEPHSTVGIRWDGVTATKRPAPNGHYSFRVVSQGAPARRPPRLDLERAAQPRLRLLRLRLPGPRPARLRQRRRPLRRRPLRPHPPGPGRDGRLRPAAGRRPRRQGPVLGLPTAPPATTSSSTARAPPTTPPTCTSPSPRR